MQKSILVILSLLLIGCGIVEKIANKDPAIRRVYALRSSINPKDTTTVAVEAEDPDEDVLTYRWSDGGVGHFSSIYDPTTVWTAPSHSGSFKIEVTVRDENGGEAKGDVTIRVLSEEKPTVEITHPGDNSYIPGVGNLQIEAAASHPDGIDKVEFYVDGSLLGSDSIKPFSYLWDIDGLSGKRTIVAQAYKVGSTEEPGVDSVRVFIEGVTPFP